MVRIVNWCYSNLNYKPVVEEILGDDITNQVTIDTSPVNLLSSVNLNRKLIKIYVVALSDLLAQIWIRHGTNPSVESNAFPLPLNKLYENTSQASRPLSVACSSGTALLRLTVVNKL